MAKGVVEKMTRALLQPVNPAVGIFLGAYTVLWGLWLLSPFWTVFTSAQLYSELMQLAPESFWGSLAVFCGIVTSWGAFKRTESALLIGSAVASWHWGMISLFYFLGDWANTGGITALTFAAYASFLFLNIMVNSKRSERHKNLWVFGFFLRKGDRD